MNPVKWHILDVGSIWLKEFAAALGRTASVICWQPEMRLFGAFEGWERESMHQNPALLIRQFPLQPRLCAVSDLCHPAVRAARVAPPLGRVGRPGKLRPGLHHAVLRARR